MIAPPQTLETLDVDACLELLARQSVGRLAFVVDDQPMVLPVNYLFDRGVVLVRTAPGSKLDAAVRGELVAFEIDGIDEDTRSGWSVLVKGSGAEVWEADQLAHVRGLALRPWAGGEREHYLVILSSQITGRRVTADDTGSLAELWWG